MNEELTKYKKRGIGHRFNIFKVLFQGVTPAAPKN